MLAPGSSVIGAVLPTSIESDTVPGGSLSAARAPEARRRTQKPAANRIRGVYMESEVQLGEAGAHRVPPGGAGGNAMQIRKRESPRTSRCAFPLTYTRPPAPGRSV